MLDASATVQYVLVERAHAGTFKGKSTLAGNAEPVSGATVTITTPSGTVLLATEDPSTGPGAVLGQYRIALDIYGITRLAVGTYTLSVTTRESEQVTGTTTLFADASTPIQSPVQTASPTDTIHVRWPSVAGARSYEVRVTSPNLDPYVVFGDSAIAIPATARTLTNDPVFPSTTSATLVVSAVDENYYEYYRGVSDPYAGSPPSRLDGGLGVFGAIVPLRILRVFLCPNCP